MTVTTEDRVDLVVMTLHILVALEALKAGVPGTPLHAQKLDMARDGIADALVRFMNRHGIDMTLPDAPLPDVTG